MSMQDMVQDEFDFGSTTQAQGASATPATVRQDDAIEKRDIQFALMILIVLLLLDIDMQLRGG